MFLLILIAIVGPSSSGWAAESPKLTVTSKNLISKTECSESAARVIYDNGAIAEKNFQKKITPNAKK
jgi:hypothetical protein